MAMLVFMPTPSFVYLDNGQAAFTDTCLIIATFGGEIPSEAPSATALYGDARGFRRWLTGTDGSRDDGEEEGTRDLRGLDRNYLDFPNASSASMEE
jgi:hypothetical protein